LARPDPSCFPSVRASPVAINRDPPLIGAASGLYGFVQMANGAVCTLMVGLIPADPAFAAATVLLAGLLLGQSFFLLAMRQPPAN
jgi:MFS transporter, DHA1 family, multidrug resistance protein